MSKTTRVATDVGGTFTDLVAIESGADGVTYQHSQVRHDARRTTKTAC